MCGGWMDAVPGFVPRVLRDQNVGLFRAEDRVFETMLDGWRSHMLARGLLTATIEPRCRVKGASSGLPASIRGHGGRWTSTSSWPSAGAPC